MSRRFRWTRPYAAEGVCGEGHRLTRDGCAICGPTVSVPVSVARDHVRRGDLVEIRRDEVIKGDLPDDVRARLDELLSDVERQSAANASLQAEFVRERERVAELEAALEEAQADAVADRERAERLLVEARALRETRGEPATIEAQLDELSSGELVELAELVRVDKADERVKPFSGRAHKRARAYLNAVAADTVRLHLEARR